MAFLQRLAESLREGMNSLNPSNDASRRQDVTLRTLSKQSSKGKARPTSVPFSFLESHIRDAIATFVQDKFDKGEAKPHVFTQFWLQFPKLEAGFGVLRQQLELRTGNREGPLPLAVLQSNPQDFGIDESSVMVRELCNKALSHKCTDIDFIGLVMLLLVVHLTESGGSSPSYPTTLSSSRGSLLHPDVRTMLSCLELAFTHFKSARRGKLDKREVAEALQHESAKAHTREGVKGRTGSRLAHRLFEGLDWEHDNTISFENFLRGILQLVQDEFGDVSGDHDDDLVVVATETASTAMSADPSATCSGSATPSVLHQLDGVATPTPTPTLTSTSVQPRVGSAAPRRWGSTRVDSSCVGHPEGGESLSGRRSASATGLSAGCSASQHPGSRPATAQRQAHGPGSVSVTRSPSGAFLAALKGSLQRVVDVISPRSSDFSGVAKDGEVMAMESSAKGI